MLGRSDRFLVSCIQSGRCADIYTPSKPHSDFKEFRSYLHTYLLEPVFIGGNIVLGCFALGTGFVRKKIPLLILRALAGTGEYNFPLPFAVHFIMCALTGAAFTIPAAFQMIVRLFPDPNEQGAALAVFGTAAALANGTLPSFFLFGFHP
jgi:MFS family permease